MYTMHKQYRLEPLSEGCMCFGNAKIGGIHYQTQHTKFHTCQVSIMMVDVTKDNENFHEAGNSVTMQIVDILSPRTRFSPWLDT